METPRSVTYVRALEKSRDDLSRGKPAKALARLDRLKLYHPADMPSPVIEGLANAAKILIGSEVEVQPDTDSFLYTAVSLDAAVAGMSFKNEGIPGMLVGFKDRESYIDRARRWRDLNRLLIDRIPPED